MPGFESIERRVLAIPEIIELILSYLDNKENASNALVCKKWSDVALDLAWRDVTDVVQLLQLLAPTTLNMHTESSTMGPAFTRMPNADDWKRFDRYGRRVRSFSYVPLQQPFIPRLGFNIPNDIALSRTSMSILPRLVSLEWLSDEIQHSILFMGESVRHFSVVLVDNPIHYALSDFLQDISVRMPSITRLNLSFKFSVRGIEDSLVALIRELLKLVKITVPPYTLTSKVVQALSELPHLEIVQFEFLLEQGRGDPTDIDTFAPELCEAQFPALRDLNLSANLSDMVQFMKNPHAFAELTSFYLHLPSPTPPAALAELLTTLADKCKQLTTLSIDLFVPRERQYLDLYADRLAWTHLRPILACTKLRTLELNWNSPVQLRHEDIEEIASNWPALQSLTICCVPLPIVDFHADGQPASLSLRALIPLAARCPDLETLALDFDGETADLIEYENEVSFPPLKRFRKLTQFHVGLSPLTEPGPAALFLSRLCPLECKVTAGPHIHDDFDWVWYDFMIQRVARWEEVNRTLPLLVRLRTEEHRRRQALEKEVEDLRMRCGVLDELARLPGGVAGADSDKPCLVL